MATITSAGSGLASETSTWVGGVVPVEGDKVIIAAGHTVTIDGTYTWGDDTSVGTTGAAAINIQGTLKASRSVSSSLTCKGMILVEHNGTLDYGKSTDRIPDGVTVELVLNKATNPTYRAGLRNMTATSSSHTYGMYFAGSLSRVRHLKLATSTMV